jgi:hypothetical protein
MHYIKNFRRVSCPEVSLCSVEEALYSLCQRVNLVINTPYRPNKRDVFLLRAFFGKSSFHCCCIKQTLAHHAIIEVKAEEKKKPKFMARPQNAGQYHDIKAVNKFSAV